jgi:hypothetical protein
MKDVHPVRLEVLEDARVVSDDENAHVLPFETGDAVGDGAQGVDVQSGVLQLTRIEKEVLGSALRRVSEDWECGAWEIPTVMVRIIRRRLRRRIIRRTRPRPAAL